MPPKRTKKPPTVSKAQGRLNFQRLQKPQTIVSPLVQILSQYQLMIMVTNQLSSADIIHLIATCKEIKMYLTDDETIYTSIKKNAYCDGKGIEARAKCFGHWKGDVTQATVQCGDSDCKPYDGCNAMVCNECRYHVTYMNNADCCRDDPLHWQNHEADFAEELDLMRGSHNGRLDGCPNFHSGNFPIESIKAVQLAGKPRERRFCSSCRPDLCDKGKLDMGTVLDTVMECEEDMEWCSCTLAEKFIEESWLCIPCFIKQEAEAYSRRLTKEFFKWETSEDGSRKLARTVKHLCDCGRVADVKYLVRCRWCADYVYTLEVSDLLEGVLW